VHDTGVARWLYRLARRHAGKQATGWRFTMKELHARSGSMRAKKDFAKSVRAVAAENSLHHHALLPTAATRPAAELLRRRAAITASDWSDGESAARPRGSRP
jgi:plasmid replication initiation protein